MFSTIRKNYVVGKEGKFEVQAELPEGTKKGALNQNTTEFEGRVPT
ncbi:MAG: hypothetical protein VKL00_10825 [Synechococcales bacterium]|nr:hypothetical protein [Synechococcales bacterium]